MKKYNKVCALMALGASCLATIALAGPIVAMGYTSDNAEIETWVTDEGQGQYDIYYHYINSGNPPQLHMNDVSQQAVAADMQYWEEVWYTEW